MEKGGWIGNILEVEPARLGEGGKAGGKGKKQGYPLGLDSDVFIERKIWSWNSFGVDGIKNSDFSVPYKGCQIKF